MAAKVALVDPVLGPLTDDVLTRDVRVWQRAKGHRFSSDDVATAYLAYLACPSAQRVLDLGCGLGSVLLHLAWKLPEAQLFGVEAQAASFELLRRNVERSGLGARIQIEHGDLRDSAMLQPLAAGFELVTGTPPYFPAETALDAEDEQRAYARVEYRGGVEAYLEAAARVLASEGVVVLCTAADAARRVERCSSELGLVLRQRCEVIPRAERPALFAIWVLRRAPGACEHSRLTLRDEQGGRTPDAEKLREFSGLGPGAAR